MVRKLDAARVGAAGLVGLGIAPPKVPVSQPAAAATT